ncbi:hypothetical protein A7U60_g3776 [Sanghuangporus baumii]|uniref:Non-reducing end beta-L-arabinofuranosidase n=1 Tax=Sanghuangporus baumii TaxID=108892 RepID=A0A9Q5I0M6_SANBA|nr:hypothetical protein A7U60_g3776 [Sanghuangporus baumii]
MTSSSLARPIELQDVSISSKFWLGRIRTVKDASLPAMYQQMKETGRWDCLKLQWKPGQPNKPHQFWDSDIAKWLEAACYILAKFPDASLHRLAEEAVDNIRGAQQEDGYINTYYTVVEPELKWANIAWSHELYCAGHLLEAALAHYTYTGSNRLLGPLMKYVRYIDSVFGAEEGKKKGYPGHEEVELSLVRTYDITDDPLLLNLADYFIKERGSRRPEGHYYDIEAKARGVPPQPGPGHGPPYSYHQADRTIGEMTSVEGHAVRAMYWLAGAAGVCRLTKDKSIRRALDRLWKSAVHRKMYVTGGLGAIPELEGFGPDYYLPNETGYLETCAAIALVFFAHQMIHLDPLNMEYARVLELALYNAVLVGVALDGKSFFYDNPLATVDGYLSRSKWFEVACCPANVARLLSSVGRYIYSIGSDDMIFVHLYVSSVARVTLSTGETIRISQESKGPWEGGSAFAIDGSTNLGSVKLCLRIPDGCTDFKVTSSSSFQCESAGYQARIVQCPFVTQKTVSISVSFSFRPRSIHPHPLNLDNTHCVAIARGPFIYCVESTDNPDITDLRAIRIPDNAEFSEEILDEQGLGRQGFDQACVHGLGDKAIILKTKAHILQTDRNEQDTNTVLTLIPYFMWANRGKSNLRVWLPRL